MRNVGGLRHAARGAAARNAKQNLKDANPKFHAGPNPLELESRMKVIAPTSAQEVAAMTRMLDDAYANGTQEQKNALEFWKMQIASGTALDEVRFQFLRRFYFWLLGRGDEEDHKKTLWGRGNAAVYNGEVAAYIDQFTSKRAQFAQQLALLADRIPNTLNGYYLYYKYIVNGNLKRVKDPNDHSKEFWDFSDEDYLQDFDLFQQEFSFKRAYGGHRGESAYSEIIAPAMERPKDMRAFEGVDQYPLTNQSLKRHVVEDHEKTVVGAVEANAMERAASDGIRERLGIGKHTQHEHTHMTHDREKRTSVTQEVEGHAGGMEEESTIAGVRETNPPQFGEPGAMHGVSDISGIEHVDTDFASSRVSQFEVAPPNEKGKEEAHQMTEDELDHWRRKHFPPNEEMESLRRKVTDLQEKAKQQIVKNTSLLNELSSGATDPVLNSDSTDPLQNASEGDDGEEDEDEDLTRVGLDLANMSKFVTDNYLVDKTKAEHDALMLQLIDIDNELQALYDTKLSSNKPGYRKQLKHINDLKTELHSYKVKIGIRRNKLRKAAEEAAKSSK